MNIDTYIFTARKRSCGKIMFPQMSICSQVEGGLGTSHASWDRSHGKVLPLSQTSDEGTSPSLPPPDIMQAGGTHPTGMLSCYLYFVDFQNQNCMERSLLELNYLKWMPIEK